MTVSVRGFPFLFTFGIPLACIPPSHSSNVTMTMQDPKRNIQMTENIEKAMVFIQNTEKIKYVRVTGSCLLVCLSLSLDV